MDTKSSWQQYQTIHFTIRTLIRFNSPVFQMHDFVYARAITFHCSSTQLQPVRSSKTDCFPVRFEHIEQHTQGRALTSTRSAHSCRILLTHRNTVISYPTQTHYLSWNGSFSAFRKDFYFVLGALDAHRSDYLVDEIFGPAEGFLGSAEGFPRAPNSEICKEQQ